MTMMGPLLNVSGALQWHHHQPSLSRYKPILEINPSAKILENSKPSLGQTLHCPIGSIQQTHLHCLLKLSSILSSLDPHWITLFIPILLIIIFIIIHILFIVIVISIPIIALSSSSSSLSSSSSPSSSSWYYHHHCIWTVWGSHQLLLDRVPFTKHHSYAPPTTTIYQVTLISTSCSAYVRSRILIKKEWVSSNCSLLKFHIQQENIPTHTHQSCWSYSKSWVEDQISYSCSRIHSSGWLSSVLVLSLIAQS